MTEEQRTPPKIGVGIIGASATRGWAQAAHIPALNSLPEYELAAVCTSSSASALAAKEKFKATHAFSHYKDLIHHPAVALVVIAVKTPDHHALLLQAIQSGKHVYCEWPLGNGMAEVKQLAALAATQANQLFAIGLQGRYSPSIRQVKSLIASGAIGRVLSTTMIASGGVVFGSSIETGNAYMLNKANGATLLTVHFGHFADYLCYVLGEFTSVSSTLATRWKNVQVTGTGEMLPADSPDQVAVTGLLGNDVIASIHIRGGQPAGTNFLWEIQGAEGDLVITAATGYLHMTELSIQMSDRNGMLKRISIDPAFRSVDAAIRHTPADSIAHLYKAIAADIASGRQTVPSFQDALQRYALVEAVEKAAVTGTRQSL